VGHRVVACTEAEFERRVVVAAAWVLVKKCGTCVGGRRADRRSGIDVLRRCIIDNGATVAVTNQTKVPRRIASIEVKGGRVSVSESVMLAKPYENELKLKSIILRSQLSKQILRVDNWSVCRG